MRSSDRQYADSMIREVERNSFLARARRRLVYTAFISASIWAVTVDIPGCHDDFRNAVYETKEGIEQIAASYVVDDGQEQR